MSNKDWKWIWPTEDYYYESNVSRDFTYRDINLKMICEACPERYEAYNGDELVGDLKLRNNIFTVSYPDYGGKIILSNVACGDSVFDEEEREFWLKSAIDAILVEIEPEQNLLPCPFCGFTPDRNDEDCIYPIDREQAVYNLNCYETGGGCSTSILGSSPKDCIKKWNTRK